MQPQVALHSALGLLIPCFWAWLDAMWGQGGMFPPPYKCPGGQGVFPPASEAMGAAYSQALILTRACKYFCWDLNPAPPPRFLVKKYSWEPYLGPGKNFTL